MSAEHAVAAVVAELAFAAVTYAYGHLARFQEAAAAAADFAAAVDVDLTYFPGSPIVVAGARA